MPVYRDREFGRTPSMTAIPITPTARPTPRRVILVSICIALQDITVEAAYDRCTALEAEISRRLPKARVTIHVFTVSKSFGDWNSAGT